MELPAQMDPQKILSDALRGVLTGCIERHFVLPFHVVFVGANDASQVYRFRGPGMEPELLAEYDDSSAMMALPVNVTVCDQRGAIVRTVIDIRDTASELH